MNRAIFGYENIYFEKKKKSLSDLSAYSWYASYQDKSEFLLQQWIH